MRERTKVLFEQPGDDWQDRSRTISLNDDISKFQYLRVYVGFGNDGFQVNEILVNDILFPRTDWAWMWTHWYGGGTPGAIGSMRINGWRRAANSDDFVVNITRITYLNDGTAAYTGATNNQWGPVQIYKVIGVYKDEVTE